MVIADIDIVCLCVNIHMHILHTYELLVSPFGGRSCRRRLDGAICLVSARQADAFFCVAREERPKTKLKKNLTKQPIMGVSPPLVCDWLFIFRSFLCLRGLFVL